MQRKLRQVRTALKEHSCVSYAKIASASGFSDISLILIKATAPDDLPLHEKYIQELLKIFSISSSSFRSFSLSLTRRFGTTRSWRVALKCLLLLHRLLRSVPGGSPFRSEIIWARFNGLLSLHPCHFRDDSSSCSVEYTVFIRSYALLLDEALNCVFLDGKKLNYEEEEEGEEERDIPENLREKMKEIGDILEILPQLQSLMDRVMGCVPMEILVQSVIVRSAMKHIIRDSFVCYTGFRRDIALVLDNLLQMPYKNCIAAFAIYKKAAVQASQLCQFYDWCKAKGLCGIYEYPMVDRIPHIQIQALETILKGMWELTESSSSPSSPTTTSSPPSSSTVSPSEFARGEKLVVRGDGCVVLVKSHNEFEDEEKKPLIDLEGDDKDEDDSWEALLESSISFSHDQSDFCFLGSNEFNKNPSLDGKEGHRHDANDSWKIQLYKPAGYNNPFSQPNFDMFSCYAKYTSS